jgi:RNA polymerase sigma-70 factor (ECF subfamily)
VTSPARSDEETIATDGSSAAAYDPEALAAAGRAAWPEIDVPVVAFLRHLADLSAQSSAPLPIAHAADVFLAFACARGDGRALAALLARFGPEMAQVIAQVDSSPSFRDEAMQVVREKLFVALDGEPPKIATYAGRAALRSWLRVVVKRVALNLVRGVNHADSAGLSDVDLVAAGDVPPDLAYMKGLYREHFEGATREAFRALSSRERTVLRLHLEEQMTLAQIGAIYEVSHATVARWLAATRAQLVDAVRRSLSDRLVLSRSEYDSLAEMVRSQLDVRVSDLLRSGTIPKI